MPARASRTRARYGVRYALALAFSGEVDMACALVEPVIDALTTVDSATTRLDLRRLREALSASRTQPAVREVMPQLSAALR